MVENYKIIDKIPVATFDELYVQIAQKICN